MSLCWGLKQQHPVIHCLFQCRRAKKAWMPLRTTIRAWNNRTVSPTACFSTRGNNKAWLPLCVGTETTGPCYSSPVSAQEQTRSGCFSVLWPERETTGPCYSLPISTQEETTRPGCLYVLWLGTRPCHCHPSTVSSSGKNKAWLAFASVSGIQVPHLFQHRTPDKTRPGCH